MQLQLFAALLFGLGAVALQGPAPHHQLKQAHEARLAKRSLAKRDEVDLESLYPAHNLSVPIDFFPNETRYEPHTDGHFNLSYWFDASYYKPGGPVFVLLSGETYGTDRLPFLQKGIVHQVIEATGGLGVILEHRYYGTSFPFDDLSTEHLRFLSTEQALAEIDYFARNVEFEGIDADLTAPNTPWIAYGGSYAGAQSAFLRVVYPETFWGTISSSGVTIAIDDYWEYFEPIRQFAPPDTVSATQTFIDILDSVLLGDDEDDIKKLKEAFGLGDITDKRDFAFIFTSINNWQGTNWDPELNSPSFYYYSGNLTSPTLVSNETEALRPTIEAFAEAAGYENDTAAVNIFLNAIAIYGATAVAAWNESGLSQDAYFTQLNETHWKEDIGLDQQWWRSWQYQVCTEWGYFQTGNTPKDIKPLVSRVLDLDYLSVSCREAFNVTGRPDIWQVNKYGNYSISYPRLAIIGGNADPWRPSTPLADVAPKRNSTTEEPFLEIAHGVHHWEENGIFPNETSPVLPPYQVIYAQQFLKNFVISWLEDWDKEHQHYEL
ncbi:hypothetical protein EJ04DRAFT_578716 [Polyplosphaeria fusca]|uniref:Peptidase S28 n=1 Tax=Polyplosphaeria fusca TaxID=682080 RepID=A0A9P4QV72_9PLEO|nr:hypothetical protein EJ04DRAFT_578716 [Polyplosphaeria fusca]